MHLTDEGPVQEFLGVHFKRNKKNEITITQPHLIESILNELKLTKDNVKTKNIPMSSSKLLNRHATSEKHDGHFHYRRVIGMLNYLEKCTRPDIAYIFYFIYLFNRLSRTPYWKNLDTRH